MRIRNDAEGDNAGPLSEMMRLQTEFYARLTEETIGYLRRLQSASSPAIPGTVLMPHGDPAISASAAPGENVELQVEVENRQRVHCVVTPMLSPFAHPSGAAWFPAVTKQASILLAPEQIETLRIQLVVPEQIPAGVFRGGLMLQGFRDTVVPVAIAVVYPSGADSPPHPGRVMKTKTAKKKLVKKKGKL